MNIKYFDTPFMRITYCLASNNKRRKKIAKQLDVKPSDFTADDGGANVTFYEHTDGATCVVVDFNAHDEELAVIYGLLAHEAVHIKQFMMQAMSEKEASPEFEAYTVQRITTNLIREYASISKD